MDILQTFYLCFTGNISSTIAAQEMDKSTFVDASMIRLPDMGEIADLKDGYH